MTTARRHRPHTATYSRFVPADVDGSRSGCRIIGDARKTPMMTSVRTWGVVLAWPLDERERGGGKGARGGGSVRMLRRLGAFIANVAERLCASSTSQDRKADQVDEILRKAI